MPRIDSSGRVLVLYPGALGDFLCALPALCALQHQHGEVLIVANPGPIELIKRGPFRIASMQRREVADLFSTGTPNEATRALFANFALTHSWTGFDRPGFMDRLGSITGGAVLLHKFRGMAPRQHAVDYHARCVALAPLRPQIWTTDADDEWASQWLARHVKAAAPLLIIHPGSGAPRKNWEGFDALIERLAPRWSMAAILGPAEAERTPAIDLGIPTVRDASVREVAALLRRATIYLGNDSGISHLAATVGAPSIVLFGATDAPRWAPRGATVIESPEPCSQCGPERLCTHRITVDAVVAAIERLTSDAR